MALEEYGQGGIFLNIKHHSICEESKKPREGFKPVEVTNPRTNEVITKYIKPYRGVSGFVNKMEWYDREYNGTKFSGWKLHIDADGVACILDIPFDSRACGRYMKTAENIDFRKAVRFSAWHDRKDDATAFNIQQDGTTVPQKYTRENPHDMPEPTQGFRGKWDYGAQEEFLYNRMVEVVLPTVDAAAANRLFRNAQAASESEPVKAKAAAVSSGLEPDDPFRDAPDPLESGVPDDEGAPF